MIIKSKFNQTVIYKILNKAGYTMLKITQKGQILRVNRAIRKRKVQRQKIQSQSLKNRLDDQYDDCKKFASQKRSFKLSKRKLARLSHSTQHLSMDRKIKFDMATTILAICSAYQISDYVYLYCLYMVLIIDTLPNELTLDFTNQISVAIIKRVLEIFQQSVAMTREHATYHFKNWDQDIMEQAYQEIRGMRFNIDMASFYRNEKDQKYTDAIKIIQNYIRTQYQMHNPKGTKQELLKPKHTQRVLEVPKIIQTSGEAYHTPDLPQTKNSASVEPVHFNRKRKEINENEIKFPVRQRLQSEKAQLGTIC